MKEKEPENLFERDALFHLKDLENTSEEKIIVQSGRKVLPSLPNTTEPDIKDVERLENVDGTIETNQLCTDGLVTYFVFPNNIGTTKTVS